MDWEKVRLLKSLENLCQETIHIQMILSEFRAGKPNIFLIQSCFSEPQSKRSALQTSFQGILRVLWRPMRSSSRWWVIADKLSDRLATTTQLPQGHFGHAWGNMCRSRGTMVRPDRAAWNECAPLGVSQDLLSTHMAPSWICWSSLEADWCGQLPWREGVWSSRVSRSWKQWSKQGKNTVNKNK